MNTIRILVMIFFIFAISACDEDNKETEKADFGVIGITAVTINDTLYRISGNVLLELEDSNNIALTGSQTTETEKSCIIEYTVIQTIEKTPKVTVSCCHSDVSVDVNSETKSNGTECITINISRKGYKEQVTYRFYFLMFWD